MRYMSSFLLALKNLKEMICVLITIQRGNKDGQAEKIIILLLVKQKKLGYNYFIKNKKFRESWNPYK